MGRRLRFNYSSSDNRVQVSREEVSACNKNLREAGNEAIQAIRKFNNNSPSLFRFGEEERLVFINKAGHCVEETVQTMLNRLTKHCDFVTSKGAITRPREEVVKSLLNRCPEDFEGAVPKLRAVSRVPLFGKEGVLHSSCGYSPEMEVYFKLPSVFDDLDIPTEPSTTDLAAAKHFLLNELLVDFPFEDETSKAHALAAILLPFVREMIDGRTPLHLISKPKTGTGANLLATCICMPSCDNPALIVMAPDESERQRQILALLLRTPVATILDNATHLGGSALASVLTSPVFHGRLIGSSALGSAPNRCLWLATANNPVLSDEIVRRTIEIRVDANAEDPTKGRKFRHSKLEEWAKKNRRELAQAALTIIQDWIAKGCSPGNQGFGGFEEWASILGGILQNAGIPGFLGNRSSTMSRTDASSAVIGSFIWSWWEKFGQTPVTANQLVCIVPPDLLAPTGRISMKLGHLLAKHCDQRFGDLRLKRASKANNYYTWRLIKVPDDKVVDISGTLRTG